MFEQEHYQETGELHSLTQVGRKRRKKMKRNPKRRSNVEKEEERGKKNGDIPPKSRIAR